MNEANFRKATSFWPLVWMVVTFFALFPVFPSCSSENSTNDGMIEQSSGVSTDAEVSDQWEIDTIRSKGNSGTHSDFQVLEGGTHVASLDTAASSTLFYGLKEPDPEAGWTFFDVDSFGGYSKYLTMIVDDQVYIAYFDAFNVKFATKGFSDSEFNVMTVDNHNYYGHFTSLAKLDDTLVIAYQACLGDCIPKFFFLSRELRVAFSHDRGATWQTEEVEDLDPGNPLHNKGWGAKVFVNDINNFSIVAYDGEEGALKVYDHNGDFTGPDNWHASVIQTGGIQMEHISVAVDSDTGLTAVAYYDDEDKVLKVATRGKVGQSWDVQTAIASGNVGIDNSVAIRPSDQAIMVSAYDLTHQGLRFAFRGEDGLWNESELVTKDKDSGQGSSLSITPEGNVEIAFFQRVDGDLKRAWRIEKP